MYIYKNNTNTTSLSERKVIKTELSKRSKSSFKRIERPTTPKKSNTNKELNRISQNNKDFLEQLGYTLKQNE